MPTYTPAAITAIVKIDLRDGIFGPSEEVAQTQQSRTLRLTSEYAEAEQAGDARLYALHMDIEAPDDQPTKSVMIGVTRIVVDSEPEKGLSFFRTQAIAHDSDILKIDLPAGQFIRSVFLMIDGVTVLSIPLEPEYGMFLYEPRPDGVSFDCEHYGESPERCPLGCHDWRGR